MGPSVLKRTWLLTPHCVWCGEARIAGEVVDRVPIENREAVVGVQVLLGPPLQNCTTGAFALRARAAPQMQ
jgi:hypothetical protein